MRCFFIHEKLNAHLVVAMVGTLILSLLDNMIFYNDHKPLVISTRMYCDVVMKMATLSIIRVFYDLVVEEI